MAKFSEEKENSLKNELHMNNGNLRIKDKLSDRSSSKLQNKQTLSETSIPVNNLNRRIGQLSLLVNIDRLSNSDLIKYSEKQRAIDLNNLINADLMYASNSLQNRNNNFKTSGNTSLNISNKLLQQFLPTVNIYSRNENLKKHLRECFVIIKRLSGRDLNKYLKRCDVIISNKICDSSRDLTQLSNLNSHNLLNIGNNNIEKSKNVDQSYRFILRERKQRIDYKKMHQGSSFLGEKQKDSIPTYKKETHAKAKRMQKDVYDFDSDSENSTKKMRNTLDKSVPFEKDMKLIMYEIEAKNKKDAKKKKKNLMKTKPKTQKNIDNSMTWKVFYEAKHKAQHFKLIRKRRNKKTLNVLPNKELQIPENGFDGENQDIHDTVSFGDNLDNSDTSFILNNVPDPPNKVKIIQNILLSNKELQLYENSCNFEDHQSIHDSDDESDEKLVNSVTSYVENAIPESLNKSKIIESIALDTNGNKISTLESHANLKKNTDDVTQSSPVSDNTDNTVNIFEEILENDDWIGALDFDKFDAPKLSSTRLNGRSTIESSTPWRPNLGIKINPHFLQYKETSLPTYNQEMVMDSSVTEKLASGNKTPNNFNRHLTNTKQSSILPYVNGKQLNKSPHKFEISLYDIHEFSPIKQANKSPQKLSKSLKGKENKSLKDSPIKKKNVKVKRQILGENVNNRLNIMNNTKKVDDNVKVDDIDDFVGFDNSVKENGLKENESRKMKKNPEKRQILGENVNNRINIMNNTKKEDDNANVDDIDDFFGFDNSVKENDLKENESRKMTKNREVWLFGKPLRLDDFVKVRKTNNVDEETIHVPNNDETQIEHEQNGEEESEVEIEDNEIVEEEGGVPDSVMNGKLTSDIGLFEDLAPIKKKLITKIYEYPKRRKRVRRVSVVSVEEDEDHQHHRKRKKDMRTKKEEEEADKWAKAFNMMCQEVEEFPLEIE